MKFIKKHFPILFFLFVFISCQKNVDIVKVSSLETYENLLEKAKKKDSIKQLDSAFYFLNKAKLICKSDEKEKKVYALLGMAEIQNTRSDFVGLEETITEALSILDETMYKSNLYNLLGIAYQEQYNYDNALLYYDRTLNLTNDELYKCIIKNNIAVVYIEQKRNKEAIEILTPILNDIILRAENISYYAKIIDNLGFAYFKNNQKEKGYGYLKESLRIRDSIGNDYEKIASLIHLSRFHKEEDPILAKEFAQKALQSAINVNSPDDKLEALSLLTDLSAPSESKGYFKDYIRINDSITTIRQTAKNQFANIKYESSNAIKDAENQKSQKIIYLLLFVVSVLSGVFIFYFIRKKNKEKLLKTAYDTETRISKRLHDELANDVFNTMMYLETQDLVEQTRKDKVLGNLENIYEKARNISKQTSGVNTGKDFGETIKEMLLSYKSDRVNIIKKGNNTIKWETVAIEKQIEIHRVLQEVLVNMKKHSEATLVVIVFETLEKSIRIKYSDNGIGFDMEKISKNGVRNMENRMQSINGSITFDSEINKGVKINIEFPK
uniref:tetratricopeptide repeat-containing sensor histidine kinase n=1 Tax=Flavobacterium sp. TaxID=239 RepID=UPI004048299C